MLSQLDSEIRANQISFVSVCSGREENISQNRQNIGITFTEKEIETIQCSIYEF